MGVRKLKENLTGPQSFHLSKESSCLLVDSAEGKKKLFFLEQISSEDAPGLNLMEGVSFKFIGNLSTFKILCDADPCFKSKLKNNVIVNSSYIVHYNPDSGSLKYLLNKNSVEAGRKKVLIIDDSKPIQKILSSIINRSSKMEVAWVASSPSEALNILENARPDLITLDIHLPEMNGVEFLKQHLIKKTDAPIVMISSVSMNEGPLVMEALDHGAATYIEKPSLSDMGKIESKVLDELEKVAKRKRKNRKAAIKTDLKFNSLDGLIAIGASTGGTKAIQDILTTLPDEIPPIVIVQHIPAVFSKAFADRLDTLCPFKVKEAVDGEVLEKNTVYIAPGGRQFRIGVSRRTKTVEITDDPQMNGFKPSVDYLFKSIANQGHSGPLISVILTGMGKDGARGLLELKTMGAYTMAQDEESSVVFGMPKEAIRVGAADSVHPLSEMSYAIVSSYNQFDVRKKVTG